MNTSQDDIEQLVQARWRAIGLSQSDLAEVLCAASVPDSNGLDDTTKVDARRLAIVADMLGLVTGIVSPQGATAQTAGRPRGGSPAAQSLQSLLELRMLRVFREVQDPATKRVLIELAEQIVKRQTTRSDAG
ncbi:hypothetical protein J6500_14645 [Bradyrhizobium sp. WSM 1704]|uniref:hypothetical protein n=1 Tax=Bradyrhizobium semiaridum TaxID=2821404 RepID=UPI001CE26EE2|nr:hypothetical protein [Bradyrhizobium semiaridum]MCA6123124.1 hypothetical protein [Bradyrhizobium semiaridum]